MNNSELENKIKQSLEMSVQAIDADTRKRLADIRRQSLQTQARSFTPARWLTLDYLREHYWLAAVALVFCALFAIIQLKAPTHAPINQDQLAVLETVSYTHLLQNLRKGYLYEKHHHYF